MEEKNKAVAIIKKAQEDLSSGKITRRDFNSIMMTFGAVTGYTLFGSFAEAWTGTRMRKSSGLSGYQISRSLRFRSSASAYLSRTMTTPTNNKKFTWSGWIKLGSLSTTQVFYSASFNSLNGLNFFYYNGSNQFNLYYEGGGMKTGWITTSLFRDPSAWYHVVLSVDTTQASYTTMVTIYVNGVAQTLSYNNYSSTYITQNTNMWINSAIAHNIGRDAVQGFPTDGYLSEVNFIDGQTLTPSSFGQIDATTGVWTAKKYAGTYGINGFYLPFTDTSSTTNLVKDSSGTGNHWTPNNISLTAGVTYDSMTDVPLAYGTTDRGNFCTLTSLWHSYTSAQIVVSDGNLKGMVGSTHEFVGTTMPIKNKVYFEVNTAGFTSSAGTFALGVGIAQQVDGYLLWDRNVVIYSRTYVGAGGPGVANDGIQQVVNGSSSMLSTSAASQFTTNDLLSFAADPATGNVWLGKNGTWFNSGNPSTGANPTFTFTMSNGSIFPMLSGRENSNYLQFNFGQYPFTYTAPTGFKAHHVANLSAPAIVKPNQYFDVLTHTGNGSTQTISGANFKADFIWVKTRSTSTNHQLQDSVRGLNLALASSTTGNEGDNGSVGVTGATTTGFSVGSGSAYNTSATTYVNWLWKAGGTAVANNNGSISSQVSVNATSGFSIVTWTGEGSSTTKTVGHGLGVTPLFIIAKNRTAATQESQWTAYHKTLGAGNFLRLNTTEAIISGSNRWGGVTPTSSFFTVGGDSAAVLHESGVNYVAYCFSEVEGFSKIGTYTGNGSTDGPFVHCGFRPRYILIKRYDAVADWYIYDTARDTYNIVGDQIWANLSNAEVTATADQDIVSNGFKIRRAGSAFNTNGGTHIFIAFAETPFKYAGAR